MYVSQLAIYPVKSLRQMRLEVMGFDAWGPLGDRRWMLVDPSGRMVTLRQDAGLTKLLVSLSPEGVVLSAHGHGAIQVSDYDLSIAKRVTVWEDEVAAFDAGDKVAQWLAGVLGREVRLVRMAPAERRQVDTAYALPGTFTAFSDGFPVLLASEASLSEFNSHLMQPVGMERFRPNVVVSGSPPWAEDSWRTLKIGELVLRLVKPCSRCVIPSMDPQTGEKRSDVLQALKTHRGRDGKTWFGQNALIEPAGAGLSIKVGDPVAVLE